MLYHPRQFTSLCLILMFTCVLPWWWLLFSDDCLNNPCQSGGSCSNTEDSYSCSCEFPWKGQDCTWRKLWCYFYYIFMRRPKPNGIRGRVLSPLEVKAPRAECEKVMFLLWFFSEIFFLRATYFIARLEIKERILKSRKILLKTIIFDTE